MKAKEFAEYFIRSKETPGIEKEILLKFADEVKELAEKRGKKDEVMLAILREEEDKWKSFCKEVKKKSGIEINPKAFRMTLFNAEMLKRESYWLSQSRATEAEIRELIRKYNLNQN